jgi:membrane peptidoglycan carboxypeptidase
LSYGEIPEVMVHAILAIEDRRFFEHSGVDVVASRARC